MKAPQYDPDWPTEVKELYRHDMEEIWNPSINRHMWNQYHNQLDTYIDLVDRHAPDGKIDILDVGCAQGTLALKLAERGHRVVANDIREPFLEYAKCRYTEGDIAYLCGNIFDLNIDRKFDVIFANQIIEHLVYPRAFVGHLKAMLKPGGKLVVTTPNWHYVKNDLPSFSDLGDVSSYEDRQFTADADGHFFAYQESELQAVFAAEGFDTVDIYFFETPLISGHMKIRYAHNFLPVSLLRLVDRTILASPLKKRASHQLMVVGSI